MSRFVVLQHGSGICRDMLRVSFQRTREWCLKHDLAYRGCTRRLDHGVPINWEKIAFWRETLPTLDYGDEGVFMDADTFVRQPDVSPRLVLPPDKDLGIRWWEERQDWCPSRWQNGVMFFRKTPTLEKIVADTWALRYSVPNTKYGRVCQDEWAMNEVLKGTDLCHSLYAGWNAFRPNEDAIIAHYPGWEHERVIEKLRDERCRHMRKVQWV